MRLNFTFLFILFSGIASAQFTGGNKDGYDRATNLSTTSIYSGGLSDGFASNEFTNSVSIYAGGHKDGYNREKLNSNLSIYTGSTEDGYAASSFNNTLSIYAGGDQDGYATAGFSEDCGCPIQLDLKIFLQGPYETNTGLMEDDLRTNGLIPTTSPYADAKTTTATVFDLGGTSGIGLPEDDIVDWVWVELRDEIDNSLVVESTSALLQSDGDIVDVDGISFLAFDVLEDDYYVMLSHRNHLGVITAETISLVEGIVNLDLKSDSNLVTGGNNGIKAMVDGSFALYAGDYNGDGQIQNTDKQAVEPLRGIHGYNNADADLNGEVQNSDIQSVLNPNIGKGVQFVNRMMFAKRKEN